MEQITISKEEYKRLKRSHIMYTQLRTFGVDNWEGYDNIHTQELEDELERLENE